MKKLKDYRNKTREERQKLKEEMKKKDTTWLIFKKLN